MLSVSMWSPRKPKHMFPHRLTKYNKRDYKLKLHFSSSYLWISSYLWRPVFTENANNSRCPLVSLMLRLYMTGTCVSVSLFSWVFTDINLHAPCLRVVGSSKIGRQKKTDSNINSRPTRWQIALSAPLTGPIICQSPTRPTRSRWCQFPPPYWVIRLIECNWAMHRSAGRRHQASGGTGGGGRVFQEPGNAVWHQGHEISTVNDSAPKSINRTDWAPHRMKFLSHRKVSFFCWQLRH